MICKKCNYQNEDSSKFCNGCGDELAKQNDIVAEQGKAICASCNTENDVESKFCVKCGSTIQNVADGGVNSQNGCPKCGAKLETDSKFCISCGTPVGSNTNNLSIAGKCSSCGFQNDLDSQFCTGCGKPMEVSRQAQSFTQTQPVFQNVVNTQTIPVGSETKKKSNKSIIVLIILAILAGAGYFGYDFLKKEYSIENSVRKLAICEYNFDACMLDYYEYDDNEFMNATALDNYYKDQKPTDVGKPKIVIVSKQPSGDGSITIMYTITYPDGSSSYGSKDMKVTGEKELFLFDKYVTTSQYIIAKDVQFTIPKDYVLSLDGIEVKKEYITETSNKDDIYTIPSILAKDYNILIENKGFEANYYQNIYQEYYSFDYKYQYATLNNKSIDTITDEIADLVNIFYVGYMNYDTAPSGLKGYSRDIIDTYDYYYDSYTEYYQLTKFSINNIDIQSVTFNDDNTLQVYASLKLKYDYIANYYYWTDEYTDRSSTISPIFKLEYSNGDFKILDVDGIYMYLY